jgi:hypothetical protein
MALRPRAVITTPYPSLAATARIFGISRKHYQELRARVTDALARSDKRSVKRRTATRRRAARRS